MWRVSPKRDHCCQLISDINNNNNNNNNNNDNDNNNGKKKNQKKKERKTNQLKLTKNLENM